MAIYEVKQDVLYGEKIPFTGIFTLKNAHNNDG